MNLASFAFARHAAIAILAVLAAGYAQSAMAQNSPLAGTWNFVPDRSEFMPGPAPKSMTLTFSPSGEMSVEGVDADGNPIHATYTPTEDGKTYRIEGADGVDNSAYTHINDNLASYVYSRGRTTVIAGSRLLSSDGNTLTFSEKTFDTRGRQTGSALMIFAKPGFETASATPQNQPARTVLVPSTTPDENAAIAALGMGDDDEAIRLFTKAIDSKDPKVNLSYDFVARGIAYARKNDNEAAVKDFDAALQLNPDDPEAHFRRGGVYVQMQRYEDAIKDLSIAIEADDTNATAYFLRGYAYNTLLQDVPGAADKARACELDKQYCN